jgi:type II secretory pathway pseudopilin PulG
MHPTYHPDSIHAGRHERSLARSRAEAGFTLVELMATALIVVLIAAGVAQGLITGAHLSGYQRHHSQANALAQQAQERLRGLSSKQLDGLNQTQTVTLDGTVYTVTSTAAFLNSTGTSSCGTVGTGAAAYYSAASTASWNDVSGVQSVKADSLITPPAGGSLLARVEDQTASPLTGVVVAANGPDVEAGTTDSGGCVILGALAAGSYALTFTAPGFVDQNGNLTPISASATVTSTGTAVPSTGNPLLLGQPGTVNTTFTAAGTSGTLLGQTADALSWYGAGSFGSMTTSSFVASAPAGTAVTSFAAANLFPFAFLTPTSYSNNYRVWAGKCRQMQPPTGVGTVAGGVTPASVQSLAVQEPALNVVVTYNGVRKAPAHVKISFASTSGTACNDSWYAPVAALAATSADGSLASPGQPFASTATTGATESASTLTGALSVCADYNNRQYTTPAGSPVTNTNFSAPTLVTIPILSSSAGLC